MISYQKKERQCYCQHSSSRASQLEESVALLSSTSSLRRVEFQSPSELEVVIKKVPQIKVFDPQYSIMCDCNLRSCCCCLPIGKSVQIWIVVDVLIHAALASAAFVGGLFPWCAGWLLLTSLASLSCAILICRRKLRYQNIKQGEIINLEIWNTFT